VLFFTSSIVKGLGLALPINDIVQSSGHLTKMLLNLSSEHPKI
jgi:hypothetical protein